MADMDGIGTRPAQPSSAPIILEDAEVGAEEGRCRGIAWLPVGIG